MNDFSLPETRTYDVSTEEFSRWPGWAQTKYIELRKALDEIQKDLIQVQREVQNQRLPTHFSDTMVRKSNLT